MRHHALYDVINAFAEGKDVQWKDCGGNWLDISRKHAVFDDKYEYRVKPEKSLLSVRYKRAWFFNGSKTKIGVAVIWEEDPIDLVESRPIFGGWIDEDWQTFEVEV